MMTKLARKLASKWWRLNHLYYILDKEDNLILLKLNKAQTTLFKVKHPRTIVPKSRQRGISTYKVAENLDKCIFRDNTQAGIQSYGLVETKKLYRKALLMWENFDPDLKDLLGIKLISSNQEGLFFSNGSTLRIGNFRGDTLSSLHVSELAKIAAKFPEKARELKTGAFQAVSKNSYISIESTAEGASGLFYEMCMTAEALRKQGKPLTSLDFQLVFLGWTDDPDCTLDQKPYLPPHKEYLYSQCNSYFSSLEKKLNITLTQAQKNWYLAKSVELGPDIKQEYPATLEEAFEQSLEGTIYRKEFEQIQIEGRIQPNLYIPGLPVTVSYDIGVNDETVLLFLQNHKGRPLLVNAYAASGESLDHYIDIMESLQTQKGYKIIDVILPHDAKVRDFSTGRSRLERFLDRGVPARIVPKTNIVDGIEATRQFLKVLWIDSSLDKFIKALQLYRWKEDTTLGVLLKTPLHDWTSNWMDSLRYMAQGTTYRSTIEDYLKAPEKINYTYEGV